MNIRIKDQIEAAADEIATQLKRRESSLEQDIFGAEKRIAALRAQLQEIRAMPDRAANIEVFIDGHYQCPSCWVQHGVHANLRAIPSDNGSDDLLKCAKCGKTLRITYPR